jgi:hypothetical protein
MKLDKRSVRSSEKPLSRSLFSATFRAAPQDSRDSAHCKPEFNEDSLPLSPKRSLDPNLVCSHYNLAVLSSVPRHIPS